MNAKRLIARLTASCMALTMFFGSAASAESITVNADRLNMRKEASAASKAVGIVEKGDELSFIAEDGEWYQVKNGSRIGFVMKDYVSLDEEMLASDVAENTEPLSLTARTTARINMRRLPITDSDILKVIPNKAEVQVIGQCGVWYQVNYSGKTGYIMAQYLTIEEGGSTAAPSAPESSAGLSKDEIYSAARAGKTSERVNMRASASASASVVEVIGKNDSVTVLGENGDWYLVSAEGEVGYIAKAYVSFVSAETAPSQPSLSEDSMYASALTGTADERLNMRTSPSTSSDIVKVISKNQTLSVLGENGTWYKVSAGGKTGYVTKEYVTLSQNGTSSQPSADSLYAAAKTGTASERVNLREEPSTSSDIVKVVSKNQTLSVLGENGGWYKISVSGKTGYISKNYVTLRTDAGEDTSSGSGLTVYDSERSGSLTERVNLREAATTSSDVVKVLSKNASVTVLGEQNGFYQVRYGSAQGFVSKNYVTLHDDASSDEPSKEETAPTQQDTIYSTTKEGMTTVKVNMRREPEGDVLYTLDSDVSLLLIGERGSWYLVSWMNTTGYVSKAYVTEVISAPSAPTQPDNSTTVKPEVDTSGKGTTAYITGSVNMRKGPGTSYSVLKVLYSGQEITYYALEDGWYMIKDGSLTGYVSSKYVSTTKPSSTPANPGVENVSGKVQQADWWTSNIQKTFARGVVATVTDVDTGLSWQVLRSGGTNHADVQPLTAADTAKMKQAYGGKWSWNRRAIWVTIDGVSYAASMNGMPHGTGSITTNNFDGHHCIHFLNSRTHTGNRWDTQHQSMVQKAYKAGQ